MEILFHDHDDQKLIHPHFQQKHVLLILDQPYFEKIPLNNSIDFKTLSNMSGVHISTLKEINAGSLRPVVNTKYAKSILLPSDSVDKYLVALKKYNSLNIPLISWAPYTFQKGDTLKKVSKKHSIR